MLYSVGLGGYVGGETGILRTTPKYDKRVPGKKPTLGTRGGSSAVSFVTHMQGSSQWPLLGDMQDTRQVPSLE